MTKQPETVFPGGQYVRPVETQPEALELAESLEKRQSGIYQAAACLRRQHEHIQELREALMLINLCIDSEQQALIARAALAKHGGTP